MKSRWLQSDLAELEKHHTLALCPYKRLFSYFLISFFFRNLKDFRKSSEAHAKMFLLNVFGVGVSCRKLYSFVVYLYVNGSGSITSVGKERAYLSAVVYL